MNIKSKQILKYYQNKMATRSCLCVFVLLLFAFQSSIVRANTLPLPPPQCRKIPFSSINFFEFLAYLLQFTTEFLLQASRGVGINDISPGLVQAGPAPIGATVASLDNVTRSIVEQMGLNGVGILRAMVAQTTLTAPLSRLLVDLREGAIANVLGLSALVPPFNCYNGTRSFLIALNIITHVIVTLEGEMATAVITNAQQALLSGIERTNTAELGVIRGRLFDSVNETVPPYTLTVGELVNITADTVNLRGRCGVKEEGLIVPLQLGAENRTRVNVVAGDANSLGYTRNPPEVLRILFATGNATIPGGVLPAGCSGGICQLINLLYTKIA